MPSRLAASLAVFAVFALAPAGAQAANVIHTTSVTASAVVPPGGTSTGRLECPRPWVALNGAVTSKGTGVTVKSSRPGSRVGDWRFRFAADTSARRSVRTILRFAFHSLHLHRVEAACLPHNTASIRLLEKVGFRKEGYARSYLCIDGRWQDHVLYAIVSDDPRS